MKYLLDGKLLPIVFAMGSLQSVHPDGFSTREPEVLAISVSA